jgi:aspartate kinase
MLTVLKFGGTSVQDAPAIRSLEKIVAEKPGKRLVVVSALAGVTDSLLAIAECVTAHRLNDGLAILENLKMRHEGLMLDLDVSEECRLVIQKSFSDLSQFLQAASTLGELSIRSKDHLVAQGELFSSRIVADYLRKLHKNVSWLDTRKVIITDSQFGSAAVDFTETKKRAKEFLSDWSVSDIYVVGGFIGSNRRGETTTLGRGGSDYSASILGSVLNADVIEIWTDVDGVLTTDPRIVPKARRIKRLSFDEASELAFFGAKVLHPATIFPAVQAKIPVWVLNSKNPKNSGTVITDQALQDPNVVKALTCKKQITMINIHSTRMLGASGFLKKVFDVFADLGISIDSISTSEVNISLTLDSLLSSEKLELLKSKLSEYSRVTVELEKSSVAIIGHGMRQAAGVAARIFKALSGTNVSMISMGSSEVNINLVVDRKEVELVIQKLHDEFFSGALNPEIFA